MTVPRIFQATSLQVSQILSLDERASHHLAQVLRATIGLDVIIFNGEGGEYLAKISNIHKKNVSVELIQFIDRDRESSFNLYLAQGIARGEKMDWIMQKATELGVKKIFPIITERCNVKFDHEREAKRLTHWQSVVISACEQSGRTKIPDISPIQTLEDVWPTLKADHCFVLSPHVLQAKQKMQSGTQDASILLLVGPEGGLSDQEIHTASAQGFLPLHLGPRILRTETAPLAALAIFQYRFGDMGF
ncbi:MAG: 16S rRNA (uracil(1498)-N(3))-methyltransferase [Gammaproteobacteria bacterium RIFCSPHIGHO2_12_FULL_38_14]|nr:MAG: 16S rRNA (uracil(1498)-N(3))-methyltransferase [Gammaproteobacteria bacterium RIFCSPHIGHO2_12_FULL_38_14]